MHQIKWKYYFTDNKDKAQLFNNYFLQASTINDKNVMLPNHINIVDETPQIDTIYKSLNDVLDQIKNLNIKKSFGHDCLSPIFFKEGGMTLILVLQKIFSISIRNAKFPLIWKKANVIPFHKKELANVVSHYHPVSLLCVIPKVFDGIVFKHVFHFFKKCL